MPRQVFALYNTYNDTRSFRHRYRYSLLRGRKHQKKNFCNFYLLVSRHIFCSLKNSLFHCWFVLWRRGNEGKREIIYKGGSSFTIQLVCLFICRDGSSEHRFKHSTHNTSFISSLHSVFFIRIVHEVSPSFILVYVRKKDLTCPTTATEMILRSKWRSYFAIVAVSIPYCSKCFSSNCGNIVRTFSTILDPYDCEASVSPVTTNNDWIVKNAISKIQF